MGAYQRASYTKNGAPTVNRCALCPRLATRTVAFCGYSSPTPISLCWCCEPGRPVPLVFRANAGDGGDTKRRRSRGGGKRPPRTVGAETRRRRERTALHEQALEIARRTKLPVREVEEALRGGRSEADLLAFAGGAR